MECPALKLIGRASRRRYRAEWRYDPNVEDFGAPVALVSTPVTFGAKNWVVYFLFEGEIVAAVLVRTEDTRYDRPQGSPEDRVRDVRAPWLREFVPVERAQN